MRAAPGGSAAMWSKSGLAQLNLCGLRYFSFTSDGTLKRNVMS